MKLELKHLAPYLPYGLGSYQLFNSGIIKTPLFREINVNNINAFLNNDTLAKATLRPLSDLYKNKYKELFESLCLKHKSKSPMDVYRYIQNGNLSYDKMTRLFMYQFDVFGLIEAGLAIDINTL